MKLIFVVEDHDVVRRGVKSYLEMSGYQVLTFANLETVQEALDKTVPDLILQDVMLPDGDGFDFIEKVKAKHDVPVVFMTAKISEEDRIRGFELGADDYIVKPFSLKELVLRVQAIFKRLDKENKETTTTTKVAPKHCIYSLGDDVLEWDDFSYTTKVNGNKVDLTTAERSILRVLITSNDVVSRQIILEQCFNYTTVSYNRIVDTHIKNLRAKLGNSCWIETIRGTGYRFLGCLKEECDK